MKHFFFTSFIIILLFPFFNKDSDFVTISIEGDPLPCVDKSFPIAFHTIKDSLGNKVSAADIALRVNNLNELFEPICISFTIDTIRTIENHSYDIIDKTGELESMTSIYHIPYRINVYLGTSMGVSFYEGGFATFEGITENSDLNPAIGVDATPFVDEEINMLAHYMGAYFGLVPTSHPLNGLELVDGSNCATAGDGLCDTPADPFVGVEDSLAYYRVMNCRFIYPLKDANDQFYNPDISNIMSYYVPCRCTFTNSQYKEMAQTYLDAPGNTW